MLGQPAHSKSFAGFVQGVLRKPILLAQRRKCSGSLLSLRAWNGTGDLPDWISPHGPQPLESFGEDGVVELPSGFQVGALAGSLANIHLQRQLEQKGRRALAGHLLLLARRLALFAHRPFSCCFSWIERIFSIVTHLRQAVKPSASGFAWGPPFFSTNKGTTFHPLDKSQGLSSPTFCNSQVIGIGYMAICHIVAFNTT